MSPEPPEPLAQVLLEILALSNSTRTGQSESGAGTGPNELSDGSLVEEQSQRTDGDDYDGQGS